jgi:uncharacterized protein YcbX
MPHLARIRIYPLKSFDGCDVDSARVLANGALEQDRRFALCDKSGNFVQGKRSALVHRLETGFDVASQVLEVRIRGAAEWNHFRLPAERDRAVDWFGSFFGQPLELLENQRGGYPDDVEAAGPTVISTATLTEVAAWFPGMSVEECRRRFRANLEIDGVEAFWEDRLYAAAGELVQFQIGAVRLAGVNPCQRCVVPSRDSTTGQATPHFQRTLAERRQQSLRSWADRSRFDHYYRLAVNTRGVAADAGRFLRIGDAVRIVQTG